MLKTYYQLTKPERTLTNVVTALAGYFFAAKWHIEWGTLLSLGIGSTLVIASACVLNNYFDKSLDQKMERTKKRVLATGDIHAAKAVAYAVLLGVFGFGILAYTNWLTIVIVAAAYFSYVVLYGIAKRLTVHSTLIGTVPGAASLVAGYTAVANRLDKATLILFIIMLSWQMVHFYAIAIYRLKDYSAAKIPVMPAKAGIKLTKILMLVYLIAFILAVLALSVWGYAGWIYGAAGGLLGLFWLRQFLVSYQSNDNESWARGVFKSSLVVIVGLSMLLAIGSVVP